MNSAIFVKRFTECIFPVDFPDKCMENVHWGGITTKTHRPRSNRHLLKRSDGGGVGGGKGVYKGLWCPFGGL